MSSLAQLPTDYKKYLDQTLHHYLPKLGEIRNLFSVKSGDSAETTYEYARQIQSYAASTGWTSFTAPETLADGSNPRIDSIGTEDGTATVTTQAKAFHIDRKLLNSSKEMAKDLIQQHTLENVQRIETATNATLITNMASAASQSYSASATWSTTGDAYGDLITAMGAFKDQAGGVKADFVVLHTNEASDLKKDFRSQSIDYVDTKTLTGSSTIIKPLGLQLIEDPAITTGFFLMGARGMFGTLFETEKFVTFEKDEGAAGKKFEIVYSYKDVYTLPYMLMYGSGV